MADLSQRVGAKRAGTPLAQHRPEVRLPLVPFGLSLGLFLTITYILCVGFDLIFPSQAMYPTWQHLLPGFTWLSWQSFGLGLVETFAYGWYVALIFAPLFNVLAGRFG